MRLTTGLLFAAIAGLAALPASAQWIPQDSLVGMEHQPRVTHYARAFAASFVNDAMLQSAVRESTEAHRRLDWEQQRMLDREWRNERANRDTSGTYGAVLGNRLSDWLKERMADAPHGAVTEIYVIDGLGWNVGQTGDTADFFQGDETQWQEVLPGGQNASFVSELEDNGEGERTLALVSLPINDGTRNLGVVTIGVDTSKLP